MCVSPYEIRLAKVLADIEMQRHNPLPIVLEGTCPYAERRRIDAEFVDPLPEFGAANKKHDHGSQSALAQQGAQNG